MNRLLPLATLVALTLASPAHAFFSDSEARRDIGLMRQDQQGLSDRLEANARGQLELANQNEVLRAEVAKLRGQIEVLLYEVESLKERQRAFYVDLDNRVRQLETTPSAPAAPAVDPAAESRDYESALNQLKEGRAREALAGFEQFITRYPQSAFLPGAHFWAGNAALQAKEVASARNYFNTMLTRWPDDATAPDALLVLANSQQAMGDAKGAQDTLKRLIDRHPSSSAAQAARQRLTKRP